MTPGDHVEHLLDAIIIRKRNEYLAKAREQGIIDVDQHRALMHLFITDMADQRIDEMRYAARQQENQR